MLTALLLICFHIPFTLQVYSPEFLAKIPPVEFCKGYVSKTDLSYYLFKSASQKVAITLHNGYIIPDQDRNLPMKILVHGFTSNTSSPWYKEIKMEYFKKGPHNVIYVDWSRAAIRNFSLSASNIKYVGEYVAQFIVNLRVPLKNIHLIGHSLGSHLVGFIGKNVYRLTGKKVGRITGNDPAGPGFEKVEYGARLSKYDATFVDVMHTDAGYYGIIKPIGHADFYVNGGRYQAGCPPLIVNDNCSHARANEYFIESIYTKDVFGKIAKFIQTGEILITNKPDEIPFGDATPSTTRGVFYLKTNKTKPYLIPKDINIS